MRGFIIIIILCITSQYVFSQKETNNWCFGSGIELSFNGGIPTVTDGSSLVNYIESSASISNANGDLLFYSDGITVWDKNHYVMPNGTGLKGDNSTSQVAVIIQKPNSTNIYYLFSLEALGGSLFYSIIDMNLNGGLGAVKEKNIFLMGDNMTEKLTAVKHCNNRDVWLVSVKYITEYPVLLPPQFCSFLITPYGINSPVFTDAPNTVSNIGQMKASPNGKYLAWDGINHAFFDNYNGTVSNFKNIPSTSWPPNIFNSNYLVEFSPNSEVLYTGSFQIDLLTNSISYFVGSNDTVVLGIQLALNDKIYTLSDSFIYVINDPNILGVGCNPAKISYNSFGKTPWGVPNFMSSYFYHPKGEFTYTGECTGMINFQLKNTIGIDSVHWIFHDNSISKNWNSSYLYSQVGTYEVKSVVYVSGVPDTTSQCVSINGVFKNVLGKDTSICVGNKLEIFVPYYAVGKYLWNNGDTTSSLMVNEAGTYSVKITNACGSYRDTIVVNKKSCEKKIPFFIPNVFTPNDDGHNDVFQIKLLDYITNEESLTCDVFNRWGERVGFYRGINGSWDGKTAAGIELSSGVYYYHIEYIDENNDSMFFNGYIQLIR